MSNLTKPLDVPTRPGIEVEIGLAVVKVLRGVALGSIPGTGYAQSLNATNGASNEFIGISLMTVDNSGGSAGDKRVVYLANGLAKFNSSSLTQADVGKAVFFSDDNTVTTTVLGIRAGVLETLDNDGGAFVRFVGRGMQAVKGVALGETAGTAGTGNGVAAAVLNTTNFTGNIGTTAYTINDAIKYLKLAGILPL